MIESSAVKLTTIIGFDCRVHIGHGLKISWDVSLRIALVALSIRK